MNAVSVIAARMRPPPRWLTSRVRWPAAPATPARGRANSRIFDKAVGTSPSRTTTSTPVPRTTGTLASVSPASTRKTRLTSSRNCSSRSLRTPAVSTSSRRCEPPRRSRPSTSWRCAHVGQLWMVFSEKKLGTASMLTSNAVSRMPNAFKRDMCIVIAPRLPMRSQVFAGAPTGPTRRP
jgi:hypothetical protein